MTLLGCERQHFTLAASLCGQPPGLACRATPHVQSVQSLVHVLCCERLKSAQCCIALPESDKRSKAMLGSRRLAVVRVENENSKSFFDTRPPSTIQPRSQNKPFQTAHHEIHFTRPCLVPSFCCQNCRWLFCLCSSKQANQSRRSNPLATDITEGPVYLSCPFSSNL